MSMDKKEATAHDLMTRLGLSKDEASLFVLLSRVDRAHANWLKSSEISTLAKKGRVRTYQVLHRLIDLGLAKVDYSRPKRYSAVAPQVALRRLLAAQETKLTELSHLESEAIETLLALSPIRPELAVDNEESRTGTVVSLLQGLANIQVALREIMENANLVAVLNDESIEHIMTVTNFLAMKPKSMRVVFASPKRSLLRNHGSVIKENSIQVSWFKKDVPTFVASTTQSAHLYYMTKKARSKLLSPLISSSSISQIAIISSQEYAQQLTEIFELLWRNSESLSPAKKL
jgi:Sugar-specific transcriptional regulator TrmB